MHWNDHKEQVYKVLFNNVAKVYVYLASGASYEAFFFISCLDLRLLGIKYFVKVNIDGSSLKKYTN